MTVVVDASVAMSWCFENEASPYVEAVLDRVRDEGAVVPGIWTLEVANAIATGERRQRLLPAGSSRFLALLRSLPITVEAVDLAPVFGTVLDLTRAHGLTSYDASYLELALRLGLPLASQDQRVQQVATRLGVALA